MKVTLAAFSLLLMGVAGCTTAPDDPVSLTDRAPVDAAIEEVVARGAFPLLYVRVETLDGGVVYEHSATNPEFTTVTPTGDTWMRIWSMTKSVTIATILDLEEDGLLNRTDPVIDYIPEFADLKVLNAEADRDDCEAGATAPSRPMTIEDLLNHAAGFYYPFTPYACLNSVMRAARLTKATSSDDLIARIATFKLHPSGVGTYKYGIGTTVLSLVAERAVGKPFDEIVRERLTDPLEISDTLRYTLPEDAFTYPRVTGRGGGPLRLARGGDLDIYGGPVPEYGADTKVFFGGAGMVSTTKGFATFLRMMGNGGELNGVRILDEATVSDWASPKTQLDSAYGVNGFNIWIANGRFDKVPNQKPGLLIGGGYEGTAFWIDREAGYVGLIMSQVHSPVIGDVDEVTRIRGLIYQHILEPGVSH